MVPKFRAWDEIARETFSNTTEIYRHKPKGMLTNLYHKMNHRNKKNGYGDLAFTLNDFKDWAFKSEEFLYLFDVWVQSGYSKKFKPSVDRKNPYKGYQFDNMQWMFWFNNYQKGINEVAKKKRKPILMYKEGMYLGKFKSIEDAREFLGMKSNGDIVMVLQGKRDKVKGYTLDLSQYLGHILVETVMSFFLLPNLQTPEGLDSESNYEVDSGYKIPQYS